MMKSKIAAIYIVISILTISFLFYYIQKQQGLIDQQNETLVNYSKIDSIGKFEGADFIKTIKTFFDDVPLKVNGKKVDALEFVAYHDRMMDSLKLYQDYYEYANENYGVKLKRKNISDTTYRIVSEPFTRADTAKQLYPYFKKYVSYKDGSWYTVTTDYESKFNKTWDDYVKSVNDYNKLNNDYRGLIEDYNSYKKEVKKAIDKANAIIRDLNKAVEEKNNTLKKIAKAGLIKIDSSRSDVVIYEYHSQN